MQERPYWLEFPLMKGQKGSVQDGDVVIIGSGFSGLSVAYWLQRFGMRDITIIDKDPDEMASARNCGHIIHGTVESMPALQALHGREMARAIWRFSIDACEGIAETIHELKLNCGYRRDGYYVIAIDAVERREIQESVRLLNELGFQSDFIEAEALHARGLRHVCGARYESGSANAHPVQFRNGLLSYLLKQGVKYYSPVAVLDVSEDSEHAIVRTSQGERRFTSAVLATNAYSPLVNQYFRERKLIEPFKGQILCSQTLRHRFGIRAPHSFDHGYIYALVTEDNRLMIGGWRNRVSGREYGTYQLDRNHEIEAGLLDFVRKHYSIDEELRWEYSWTGIMAASQTGFPFIGPIGYRLFTCSGYTGHGFSWAHGSAKLLAEILCDRPYDKKIASYFNPRAF